MMSLFRTFPHIALVASLGWSSLASADPEITSPKAGAVVTSPFTVEVTYGDIEQCDTGGCSDIPASSVSLYADPDGDIVYLGSCSTTTECPNGKATFEVTLEPGEHELRATAEAEFSVGFSEHVKITVEAAATTTDGSTSSGGPDTTGADTSTGTITGADTITGAPTSTDASTSTGAGTSTGASTSTGAGSGTDTATGSAGSKDDGCGCDATSTAEGALAWLAAAMLLFRRRR